MPSLSRIGAIVALSLSALVAAPTQEAKCTHCPSYGCFGPCGQCSCMRRGPGPGECVSFDRVHQYQVRGYTLAR